MVLFLAMAAFRPTVPRPTWPATVSALAEVEAPFQLVRTCIQPLTFTLLLFRLARLAAAMSA